MLGARYAKMLSRQGKSLGSLLLSKHPNRLLSSIKKGHSHQDSANPRYGADAEEKVEEEQEAEDLDEMQQENNNNGKEEEEEGEEEEEQESNEEEFPPPPKKPRRHSFYINSDDDKDEDEGEMEEESDGSASAQSKKKFPSHDNYRPISFETLLKVAEKMPHWTRSSVAYEFLRSLKTKLESSGWPQQEWIRLLPHLFDQEKDAAKAEWVINNIVKKTKKWNEACRLFIEHFQDRDHRAQWNENYEKCKQLSSETVQSYADRFRLICTQLGIADDNDRAIEHFLNHLTPSMVSLYYPHMTSLMASAKVAGGVMLKKLQAEVGSLDGVIQHCIQLDVAHRTATQAIAQRQASAGGSSSFSTHQNKPFSHSNFHQNNNKRKFSTFSRNNQRRTPFNSSSGKREERSKQGGCKYHPNATDHVTADCRYGQFLQRTGTAQTTTFTDKTKETPTVSCYKCGEKGHFANKCPKKESSANPSYNNNKKPALRRQTPTRALYQEDAQEKKHQGDRRVTKH
jgi:hypothetical protein